MKPWSHGRVRLQFRTYNPRKIAKYGVLVRMVCEAVLGYICNMEIYSAVGKKLGDTVFPLLDRKLGWNHHFLLNKNQQVHLVFIKQVYHNAWSRECEIHHIYQDIFYNSVTLAATLLDRNMRVCGTMRANRGIPHDLEGGGKRLWKGQSAFWRKGDIMVQVWKDKRLMWMISMIHDATIINIWRKDRKTNMEIKKPYAVVQYSKLMKGVDRADQYLSYYSVLRKPVKCSKKGGIVSAKLCAHKCIFCVQDTKYKQKSNVQELPAWGRKVLDIRSPEWKWVKFIWHSFAREATTPKELKQDLPGRLSGDFRIHRLEKIVGGGEGRKKYPAWQCKMKWQ